MSEGVVAPMARLTAVGLVAFVTCLASACSRGEPPLSSPAAEQLAQLRQEPQRLPSALDPEDEVVMVLLGFDDRGRAVVDGAPIPVSRATLRLPRAMAARRTTPPRYWTMVRREGAATMRYWAPLDYRALIRANVRSDEAGRHDTRLRRVPVMYSSVQVPFYPHAELEFVRSDGTGAGAYRFGDLPGDRLVRLR